MKETSPNTEQLLDEAIEWMRRVESKAYDEPVLLEWLCRSPEHVRAYLRAVAIHEEVVRHERRRKKFVKRLVRAIQVKCGIRRRPVQLLRTKWAAATAAVFLVCCSVLAISFGYSGRLIWWPGSYEIGPGSVMKVYLGAFVRLHDSDSPERTAAIWTGRVSFAGRHETVEGSRLHVDLGNAVLDVIGTRFEVDKQLYGESVVRVDSGTVVVRREKCATLTGSGDFSASKRAELGAGDEARIIGTGCEPDVKVTYASVVPPRSQAPVTQVPGEMHPEQPRLMNVTGKSVQEAVEVFRGVGRVHLLVTDPVLAAEEMGGSIDPTDVESFVGFLQERYHARAERSSNADGTETIRLFLDGS